MSVPVNPYTPPVAMIYEEMGISIEGSKLVVPDGYVFPPICPFTGEVTGLSMAVNRRVSAHDKWIYLLLLTGLLPYIIVAIACTKRGTFNCRLSDRATRRWRYYRLTGQILFFSSFFVGFRGLAMQNIGWVFLALVMFIGGLCTACGLFDGIKATTVRDGKLWLAGMPRWVREKVLEIEQARIAAAERAARAQLVRASCEAAPPPPLPLPLPVVQSNATVPPHYPGGQH